MPKRTLPYSKSIVEDPFKDWEEGDINGEAAIQQLVRQLATVEDMLVPLEGTRKAIRNQLSVLVDNQGGKYIMPDYGTLAITNPGKTVTYDRKKLEKLTGEMALLINDLNRDTETSPATVALLQEFLDGIRNSRKETPRYGSLRILKNGEKANEDE